MAKTKADILYESLSNFTDEEGAIECGAKMRDYARELERKLLGTEQVLRSLYFETGKLRFSILANQRTASASHFSWWHAHTEVMLDAEALLGLPKPKSDSALPNV